MVTFVEFGINRRLWLESRYRHSKISLREPVGERTSDGGLVGSEDGYRVRRGCYFLPLGL